MKDITPGSNCIFIQELELVDERYIIPKVEGLRYASSGEGSVRSGLVTHVGDNVSPHYRGKTCLYYENDVVRFYADDKEFSVLLSSQPILYHQNKQQ